MFIDGIGIGLGFLEGLALIVSPCILPVLPIVLSSSINTEKWRPYGIMIGFIIAFTGFTLGSRALVLAFQLDPTLLRQLSFMVLMMLGLIMIFDRLSAMFSKFSEKIGHWGQQIQQKLQQQSLDHTPTLKAKGLLSGILIGACIGMIWVPCSGPILAAVLVQSIQQKTDISSLLTMLAFSMGAGLPMLLISIRGQRIMTKLRLFQRYGSLIRKLAGVIILVTAVFTSQDLWSLPVLSAPTSSRNASLATPARSPHLIDGLSQPYAAPALSGIQHWINSKPLTLASLKGKVVLVDFWTYSCINCLRTLPHLTEWDAKYRDKGLVILGIHAPEFEFERNLSNVQKAVQKHGIHYPVAMDNNLSTWVRFKNQYWPAHYLIDRNGKVVYTHFGEGNYDVTEKNIQALLGQSGPVKSSNAPPITVFQTPETYLGFNRADRFDSTPSLSPARAATFMMPETLALQHWGLQGRWKTSAEAVESLSNTSTLRLHFFARKVFLVLGSRQNQPIPVQVLLNGKPYGKPMIIQQHKLYTLLSLSRVQSGEVTVKSLKPGLQAYAFTFES